MFRYHGIRSNLIELRIHRLAAVLGGWIASKPTFEDHLCHHGNDEDRRGPQNVGLRAIQPLDVATSLRIFDWM